LELYWFLETLDVPINSEPHFLSQINPVLPVGSEMIENFVHMGLIPPEKFGKCDSIGASS
jgi:hypothetical protein